MEKHVTFHLVLCNRSSIYQLPFDKRPWQSWWMSNQQNIRILHCNFQYDSVSAGHKSVMYDTTESSTQGQNKDLDIYVAAVWTGFHNSLVTLHSLHSSNNEHSVILRVASEWVSEGLLFYEQTSKSHKRLFKEMCPNCLWVLLQRYDVLVIFMTQMFVMKSSKL